MYYCWLQDFLIKSKRKQHAVPEGEQETRERKKKVERGLTQQQQQQLEIIEKIGDASASSFNEQVGVCVCVGV